MVGGRGYCYYIYVHRRDGQGPDVGARLAVVAAAWIAGSPAQQRLVSQVGVGRFQFPERAKACTSTTAQLARRAGPFPQSYEIGGPVVAQ